MYLWDVQMEKNELNRYITQVYAKNRKSAIQTGMRKASSMGYKYIETYINFHKKDKGESLK
jgi:hypothetical protein